MNTFIHKIDYTNLEDLILDEELYALCSKAIIYGVASVCTWPQHVAMVHKILKNTAVKTCTVVAFPQGTDTLFQKIEETHKAIDDGADEIDMVFNYKLLQEYWNDARLKEVQQLVQEEVVAVAQICHHQHKILKVIIESGALTVEQTLTVSALCIQAHADFIKTSTGKVAVGAEVAKVQAIREVIDAMQSKVQIKISGGIRTIHDIQQYNAFAVARIGMGYKAVDALLQ